MLDLSDQRTFFAIRELKRSVLDSRRPLVFWVGAGASRWLGYPLWKEFALGLRKEFFKYVPGFDNAKALGQIESGAFPKFFRQCRDLDGARYRRFLSEAFLPKPDTHLYRRFVVELRKLAPLHLMTTNIDESLEQHLPELAVFQRSDLTGCVEHLRSRKPFIAKLHGSRSAIESAVFTDADYVELKATPGYIGTVRLIFEIATVVFIGYGLGDQYLIDVLSDNERDMALFGAGPHFVVSTSFKETASIRRIGYSLTRFPDHRAALTVLDLICQVKNREAELAGRTEVVKVPEKEPPSTPGRTAYFISDITPPGTWNTSFNLELAGPGGVQVEAAIGLGFTNDEIPFRESTAAHNLIVALICFDVVYLPLSAVPKAYFLLGEPLWRLIQSDVIRLIHLQHEPGVIFPEKGALVGDIGLMTLSAKDGGPESPGVILRRAIKPTLGKEEQGEKLISELESRIIVFAEGDRMELASMVRASFMMPGVTQLLGMSEAMLPSQVPSWLRFPCLRMAHLVHTAAICDHLGIQAAKIPFGGVRLTSAAFGVQSAAETADQYASYVVSQRFNTDIGAAFIAQPAMLQTILRFRDTVEGEAFRREVRDQLLANEGSEFSASINAGLKKNIPLTVLEKARDKLSSLLTEKPSATPVPAVWANSLYADDTTRFWRARSRAILLDLARNRKIRGDDACICGSGEKFRLCCLSPLRN